ncbi:hypothetical protein ACUXZJ_11325 [Flavobacterium sp. TN-1]
MTKIERVRKLCKWLIYEGFAENDTELAKKLGYTKSSFSQIINEKVPLSDKFITKLCEANENINKFWILGRGDMLKTRIVPNQLNQYKDFDYKELADARKEVIEGYKLTIDSQNIALESQKNEIIAKNDKINYLESEVTRLKQELANATRQGGNRAAG